MYPYIHFQQSDVQFSSILFFPILPIYFHCFHPLHPFHLLSSIHPHIIIIPSKSCLNFIHYVRSYILPLPSFSSIPSVHSIFSLPCVQIPSSTFILAFSDSSFPSFLSTFISFTHYIYLQPFHLCFVSVCLSFYSSSSMSCLKSCSLASHSSFSTLLSFVCQGTFFARNFILLFLLISPDKINHILVCLLLLPGLPFLLFPSPSSSLPCAPQVTC